MSNEMKELADEIERLSRLDAAAGVGALCARNADLIVAALRTASAKPVASFQKRVHRWMMDCFSMEICRDRDERNHRFLEEALELVQSLGCTRSEAYQLVDYVYGRPAGDPRQEVGGTMVTLAALCLAADIDLQDSAETELARILQPHIMNKIRAKQASKPKHSPLPTHPAPDAETHCGPVGEDEWRAYELANAKAAALYWKERAEAAEARGVSLHDDADLRTACGCTDECVHKPECVFEEPKALLSDLRQDIVEKLRVWPASIKGDGESITYVIRMHTEAADEIASLRAQLATSQELCTKFEAAVGEDLGEMLKLRAQIASARKALQSVSTQCGNVIFNCEQRPAGNERHLQSWRSVKEFADASLTDELREGEK